MVNQETNNLLIILYLKEINNTIIDNRLFFVVCKIKALVHINQKNKDIFFIKMNRLIKTGLRKNIRSKYNQAHFLKVFHLY